MTSVIKPQSVGKTAAPTVFALQPISVAVLSEDRTAFTLTIGSGLSAWSGTYDIRELEGWLRFYRGLRDRRQGMFRAFYQCQVEALEKLQREVRS